MSHHEDRAKVMSAFGGTRGLLDSGLPALVFLVAFNVTHELRRAIIASLVIAAILAITRLIRKDTLQHVLSGFVGVAFCAFLANRTGQAQDFYLPKLFTNLAYGSAYLIGNIVGWPIMGLLLGPILGENFLWRKDPARKRVYVRAGWLWVALFFGRIVVQYPIYRAGNVNLLGTVNLAMGYPLFILTAWGTWMIIKQTPSIPQPTEK